VLTCDADHLADRRGVRAGDADHGGVALDARDAVVIAVVMGDQHEVGGDARYRRVVEAHAAPERRRVADRVEHHRRLGSGEQEGRLSEPADAHE
jgi:uncharacterized protein (DUF2126 family)